MQTRTKWRWSYGFLKHYYGVQRILFMCNRCSAFGLSRDEFDWNTAQVWRELDRACRLEFCEKLNRNQIVWNSKAWVYVVATFIFIDVRLVMPFVCLDNRCISRYLIYIRFWLIPVYTLCVGALELSTRLNSAAPHAATTKSTITGGGWMMDAKEDCRTELCMKRKVYEKYLSPCLNQKWMRGAK